MRIAVCLLVVVAVGALALADSPTGTVVISCNEADAALIVDGVLIPERTPAVLTLPAGTHLIEARKPPLVAQKKVVEVAGEQQVKVRFELIPQALPPTGSDTPVGSGSAAPPGVGSGAPPPSGSAQVSATGSAGSAPPPVGSAAPTIAPVVSAPVAPPPRCRQGGREVPCPPEGPHCTQGGRPVPCTKGAPPPVPPPVAAVATGSGVGSSVPVEPHPSPGAAAIEIATTVPHAIAYVDGAPVREAPCVLELEPGEHVVAVVAAGMVPAEAIVHAEASRRQRVELVPAKPRTRIDVPAP